MKRVRSALAVLGISLLAVLAFPAVPSFAASEMGPDFTDDYTLINLGAPVGVPVPFGGITIKADDPNTLLIGGNANTASGAIYAVPLTRDPGTGQITGFAGPAALYASAPYVDGGLAYAPGAPGSQVLFYTAFPTNEIGQILPDSTVPDRVDDVTTAGIAASVGSLNFTPSFAPGTGSLRVLSYSSGDFYTLPYAPAGDGTFTLGPAAVAGPDLGFGPEGLAYVPPGSAGFDQPSMLIANYSTGAVSAYEIDGDGFPVTGSVKPFITGLDRAEGAYLDSVSGEFMFSTFGGGDRVVIAQGFASTAEAPEITTGSLPNGVEGATYSSTITATGDPVPSFAVTAGALPPGLDLNAASGAITGTPTAMGDFAFTVAATNSEGTDSKSFTVTIVAAPSAPVITTDSLPNGEEGSPFDATITATGDPVPTFAVTDGALPDGLELDAASGAITGTPTVTGDFTFTVTATNSEGADSKPFTVAIAAKVVESAGTAPVIKTSILPDGEVKVKFNAVVKATGDPDPTFAVQRGALPPGLDLNSASGAVMGTPTKAGNYSFTIAATNSSGTDSQRYDVTIAAAPVDDEGLLPTVGLDSQIRPALVLGSAAFAAGLLLLLTGKFAPRDARRK